MKKVIISICIILLLTSCKDETINDNIISELTKNKMVPIDIDTHRIGYNERLNLPEHLHFDFRYLFVIAHFLDVPCLF